MYFKFTKSFLTFILCWVSFALTAKDVSSANATGLKKPLCFVENKGQIKDECNNIRTDIQYKLATPGVNVYLNNNKLLYQFKKTVGNPKSGFEISSYQMDVTLLNANADAKIIPAEEADYYENYYLSVSDLQGFTAHSFKKIICKDVYPAIDWVIYVNGNNIEYDFVIHKGGNASNIQLKYNGADNLQIDETGSLTVSTPMGIVKEKSPKAFETKTAKNVDARFHLTKNIVSFETSGNSEEITIDPFLSWSTYFGGTSEDVATSVTSYGATGIVYAAGYTASTTGVAVGVGLPFNTFAGGTYDAFVACYASTGVLSWATYFGGAGSDQGTGITTDNTGNVFLTGYTNSGGLGTPGVYQLANAGGIDAFLVKFSSAGVRQWSSYFGGTGDDYANGVTCDPSGNVYICGQTASATGIATVGAFQTALSGTTDGFVAKFTTTGLLTYATYFGGSAQDDVICIHCDGSGNILIGGQTNSTTNIATVGAYQTTLRGSNDGFVEQFSPTGVRNWGTYFGGMGTESVNGITSDASLNVAVTGNTTSPTFITTANASQPLFGGVQDAYVSKFSNMGAIQWSTYCGGTLDDYGNSITVDSWGNFLICGYTESPTATGIATMNGFQTSIAGGFDAFVSKYDQFGRRFWGTYFGGIFNDYGFGITNDVNNLVTIAGSTGSSPGLYSAGGVSSAITVQQPAFGGGVTDAFVTQFTIDTMVLINQPFTDTLVCAGSTLVVSYTTNSIASNNLSVQLSNAAGVFPPVTTANIIGTATSTTLTGTITCIIPATAAGTAYRIRIIGTNPVYTSPDDYYNIHIVASLPEPQMLGTSPICVGLTENLQAIPPYPVTGYSWTGPNGFSSILSNPSIPAVTITDSGWHYVTLTHNGCPNVLDSILVSVNSVIPTTPVLSASTPACKNYLINLYANTGLVGDFLTYSWTGPGGFTSTLQNPTVQDVGGSSAGVYTLVDTLNGCPSVAATITIAITPDVLVSLHVNANPNDTVCKGTIQTFTTTSVNGGTAPQYQWMSGTPDTFIVGAIWNSYSSAHLQNGQKIFCILTSDEVCAYPQKDTSNIITIHVIDSTPTVYIIVSPDSTILQGSAATFYAYPTYPGRITQFQWLVNDTFVIGANSPTFTIPHVNTAIRVKALVFTDAACAVPDNVYSNVIGMHFITGVENMNTLFDDITMFPNPNNGLFTIKGSLPNMHASTFSYRITNTIGQQIVQDEVAIHNNSIAQNVDLSHLPDGIYFLQLSAQGQKEMLKFVIEH